MSWLLKNHNGDTEEDLETTVNKKEVSKTPFQIFISLGPLIMTAGVGAMMGFSGIFLPQIEKADSRIKNVDKEMGSWIASSAVLPMAISSTFGGVLLEKIGRKRAHIFSAIPAIIGWATIYYADDIQTILIGRILTGVTCGLIAPITPVYIGEITSPQIRPFILGGLALFLTLGTLLCHLVGTFFSWEMTALFCVFLPGVGALLTCFSQESHVWHMNRKNVEMACESFKIIRGETPEATKELHVILERFKNRNEDDYEDRSLWNAVKKLRNPEVYKPLSILIVYFTSSQFAGINVVTFYAIDVVGRSLGPHFEQKYLIMLSMDAIRTLTSVLACVLLRKLPRRPISLIGGSGVVLCLLILSFTGYLSEIFPQSNVCLWISLLALLVYVFLISISLVSLPWCLAGEMLPPEVKGLAGGILCLTAFTGFFIAVKFSPFLFKHLGTNYTYLIFAAFCLFGTTICYFYLPETKNKTLDEIASGFRTKETSKQELTIN